MRLIPGDCRDAMLSLLMDGETFDAVITDPPYHLTSTVERFGKPDAAPAKSDGATGVYGRASRGFMGKEWDGGDIAFQPETWRAAYELLKPGAHLVAFGGSRTYHRIACAIEDAGFEIRDSLMWIYGTGFPKSHDAEAAISKALVPGWKDGDAVPPEAAEWSGWGTALKPAFEPIILARKPLIGTVAANVLQHGTGAINIDACRIAADDKTPAPVGRYGCSDKVYGTFAGHRDGSADNLGRWPANVLHDGSDEVLAAFAAFGEREGGGSHVKKRGKSVHCIGKANDTPHVGVSDSGTAARFFYSAKASAADRAGSKHPTVKPLALMRWLCRLVTPPGGSILDPFGGSGSTLQAAHECGFRATTIERDPEYQADIERRIMNLMLG